MSTQTELVYNPEDEVDSHEDVSFPKHVHHLKVRAELTELRTRGLIDDDQADDIYEDWLENRS